MQTKHHLITVVLFMTVAAVTPCLAQDHKTVDHHGWLGTETLKTRFGDFEFKGGYPTSATAGALQDQLKFNRATEVYLMQIPAVAVIEQRRGLHDFGAKTANQVIIWESLMDAKTLLLTPNTETVYAIGYLYLKDDGPTVLEAPPKMLGLAMDALQRFLVDIGPLGPDKGQGGKYTGPQANADGTVDVYFGPQMPAGQEKNWIRTVPGKGWFPIFRFYGPLPPLYDQTWKLPDIEEVQ